MHTYLLHLSTAKASQIASARGAAAIGFSFCDVVEDLLPSLFATTRECIHDLSADGLDLHDGLLLALCDVVVAPAGRSARPCVLLKNVTAPNRL